MTSTLIASEEFPSLYAAAYAFYEAGDYEKAVEMFTALTQSAPFEINHWKGLASAQQMRPDYEAALHAWSIASLLNEQDPWVHFHAAECMLSLDKQHEAAKALVMAEARIDPALHEGLRDKIELLKTIHMS
ncbi:MAG: tetratricopeptide repeat protein [Simkania sp.]|nr:tetratricopeptide repeat protein [Simkania sp.]